VSFYQVLLPVLAPRNLIFLIVQWLLESSFIFCLKKEEKVAFLLELQNSLARVADPDPDPYQSLKLPTRVEFVL
jgi:hypothetical protein